ncbi:MAG TPA: D-alanyl-D-alanine carboxypeptidase family protein [Dissulfurispiraceae bacterium]|nr:D-alanyl-D-alanine carboxypeptidase family protein [Dissulfurispiraceae bacterium]
MIKKSLCGFLFICGLAAQAVCHASPSPTHFSEGVSATAAIVMDASSERILYAKNPNLKLRPASTTKLMTVMVAMDRLKPETVVKISDHAAETPSVSPRIRAGETYTVRDLVALALMRSINGAAIALAEATAGSEEAFAVLMNRKAAEIGADNAKFINASGLPGAGQHVTVFDLAKIMKESLKYPLIVDTINSRSQTVFSSSGRKLVLKNTNELLWTESDMLGGKTGYTREARHCFVSAARKGDSILISAVLGESQRGNLWDDTAKLMVRGDEVLHRRADPVITYSSGSESPVVFATYREKSSYKKQKKTAAVKGKKGKKRGDKLSKSKAKKPKKQKGVKQKSKKRSKKKVTAEAPRPASRS